MNPKSRSCTGKVRHPDKRRAMITLRKVGNHGLSCYACTHCKGWHLGHDPDKIQKRLDQLIGPYTP